MGEFLTLGDRGMRGRWWMRWGIGVAMAAVAAVTATTAMGEELGTDGYAQSGEVKIHYVTAGEGPLVVLLHGFPDYWYSWRHQMPALAKHFRVVAIDQRGYNLSGQPEGVEHYGIDKLVGDVLAVVDHFKAEKATIVGHDWGGFVAWSFAMQHPDRTERLAVLNLPHPWGLRRELALNEEQRKNSQYARNFQMPGAEKFLTAAGLASWVQEAAAKEKYVAAFERSSFTAMLNYYRANYAKPPYEVPQEDPPPVKCPVLAIHGLKDQYLLSSGLNDNWKWVEGPYTLVTVPESGHFVQHEAPQVVTKALLQWLPLGAKAGAAE